MEGKGAHMGAVGTSIEQAKASSVTRRFGQVVTPANPSEADWAAPTNCMLWPDPPSHGQPHGEGPTPHPHAPLHRGSRLPRADPPAACPPTARLVAGPAAAPTCTRASCCGTLNPPRSAHDRAGDSVRSPPPRLVRTGESLRHQHRSHPSHRRHRCRGGSPHTMSALQRHTLPTSSQLAPCTRELCTRVAPRTHASHPTALHPSRTHVGR